MNRRTFPSLCHALFLCLLAAFSQGSARAVTVLYSSNFSTTSGANSIAGWAAGAEGGTVSRSVNSWDNFLISPGVYGGDGVKGDGSLFLDTKDATPGNEFWTYTFAATINEGDLFNLYGAAFNAYSSSNLNYTVGLYNVTDGRVMVTSSALGGTRAGADESADINPFHNFNVSYEAVAEDVGDVFQIRVVENLNNTARNINIDNIAISVTSVPEPSRGMFCLLALGGVLMRRRL
ncbi:hypothetical protein WJU23_07760 [Prosthecobacter sp. SYSU 5D2]|uniref:hypothetical protein n=1 Tax=Prosthecobacter sp. SYSU 5D2 TaxID=3134134 RepID=UPI0031FF29E3